MSVNVRACLFALAMAGSLPAVTVGQIDTFEDGTTMGWFVPDPTNPNPPTNIATGGPLGPDDNYLRLRATGGGGPGSRLAALNEGQWAGNYLAAGITMIAMDVNNFGPAELHLRLLFEDFEGAGPPVNLALSAQAIVIPAGSGWMRIYFPISPADLVVETFGTAAGALADTDTLRIFHNPAPTFPGPGVGIPTVNATLGVDNITALPEPRTISLLAGGIVLGLLARFRRRP
jgi:hypothetical protein